MSFKKRGKAPIVGTVVPKPPLPAAQDSDPKARPAAEPKQPAK